MLFLHLQSNRIRIFINRLINLKPLNIMAEFVDTSISIENWQALAQGAPDDGIISLFEKSGNSFQLTLNETLKASKRLHIYFTLDGSGEIQFFIIPAGLDQTSNKNLYGSGIYPVALSATQTTVSSESDPELVGWINNWCNETMRDNWLTKIANAPQVLVIHTDDFTVNDLHECYLALRPNANPTIPTKNRMDLVVKNTVTNTFINVKLATDVAGDLGPQFRDMARPVPPFGQENHASTDESNFGVLEQLSNS
jgi:hypothetical protein